jgi:hypothetical protein
MRSDEAVSFAVYPAESRMPCCPPRRVNSMWNLSNLETRRAGIASGQVRD